MDPSRIRLEDDRFGLIGMSFRPQNRATFVGRDGEDYVWAIGIVVGDEDEIQTVEIDEHGAKSSRMLTPGELFEGLEILAAPGNEAYLVVGSLTLLGMDLRTSDSEMASQLAGVLRAAADDRNWRLPLHLTGQPRELQLSAQGRDILRQTASTIERDGHARTSLSAAHRLELSPEALDSIRRRIARKSLQAYRMHGRWYVVLDNLARSRTSEQNGASTSSVPATSMLAEAQPSPFEEAPSEFEAELEQAAAPHVVDEEPFVSQEESTEPQLEQTAATPPVEPPDVGEAGREPVAPLEERGVSEESGEALSEDELAAFVSEESEEVGGPAAEAMTQHLPGEQIADVTLESETTGEQEALASSETLAVEEPVSSLAGAEEEEQIWTGAPTERAGEISEQAPESANHVDQFISETVLEQFIVAEIDMVVTEEEPEEAFEAAAESFEQVVSIEQTEDLVVEETLEQPAEPETPVEQPPTETEVEAEAPESAETAAAEFPEGESAESEDRIMEAATEEAATVEIETPSGMEEAESVVDETTKFSPATDAKEPDLTGEGAQAVAEAAEPVEEEAEPSMPQSAEESPMPGEAVATAGEEVLAAEEPVSVDEAPASEEVTGAEASQVLEDEEQATVTEAAISEEVTVGSEPEEHLEEVAEAEPTIDDRQATVESEALTATAVAEEEIVSESPEQPEEPILAGSTDEQAEDVEVSAGEDQYEEAEEQPAASEAGIGAEKEEPPTSRQFVEVDLGLLSHLRDEVAFLRQQGQEKDRQIVAWINGAQWLQPFVDQIRSLEQQVERLGELQAKRDGDRIADLMSERESLRQRLSTLEEEIQSTRAASGSDDTNRRSWFRRMMGSD